MIRSSIQSRARSSNIVWPRRDKSMCRVAICRDFDVAHLAARQAILGAGVGIRRGVWRSAFMVGIKWAGRLSFISSSVASTEE